MTTQYIYNLIDTWASGGGPYTSIKMDATDNDAASASLLMDLQVGTVSQFSVTKSGVVTVKGNLLNTGTVASFVSGKFGQANGSANFEVSQSIGFTNASNIVTGPFDLFLTRRAAANLRLGAADTTGTTAPTPQFLSAQSWLSSTTNNQTGANFTIDGSQGTGTGAGGSIIFRVAPAGGTSNGVQNGLVTALTINSGNAITVGANGTISFPTSATTLPSAPGIGAWVTTLGLFGTSGVLAVSISSTAFNLSSTYQLSWNIDTILVRDDANKLALRNGTAAQEMRVYETTTGTIYKAILGNRQLIKIAGAAFDNGAGASAGTLTNAPAVGNPTKWIPIDDNGTTRHIPAW